MKFTLSLLALMNLCNCTATKPQVSFAVLADIQYHQRNHQHTIPNLKTALKEIGEKQPDFILQTGDLVDGNIESYDIVMPLVDALNIPTYHVLGNHDFYDITLKERPEIYSKLQLTEHYYSFVKDNYRFIVLDGTEISLFRKNPKRAKALINRLSERFSSTILKGGGAIGNKQIAWLKEELISSQLNEEEVILVCHYPLLPEVDHTLWNNQRVLKLLFSFDNIIAYINGHYHTGSYIYKNFSFLTQKALVSHPKSSTFSVIDLYDDRIEVVGYGKEENRIIPKS